MNTLGSILRQRRQQAGLGLRTFAGMLDERASTVSAIESGQRAIWRDPDKHQRIGELLGNGTPLDFSAAQDSSATSAPLQTNAPAAANTYVGRLRYWWTSPKAPRLEPREISALADFLQAEPVDLQSGPPPEAKVDWPALTELAIEWQVGQILGKQGGHCSPGPVDVEAVLEARTQLRLEIVPGLIPKFSVQASAIQNGNSTTICIDRIVADSRPLASYRMLVASCYAVQALGAKVLANSAGAESFFALQQLDYLPCIERDCLRFALAMSLPATPVLAAAEAAYEGLIAEHGWVEPEEAARVIRNQLAEKFAVPPTLVQRRLTGWPCHLYGRIAQALAAEEPVLPPTDWFELSRPKVQRQLFTEESQP